MANFGEYPPNMASQDALIIREQTSGPQHAVVPYSGEELSRQQLGPVNPYVDPSTRKRKNNVLTGTAEETFVSEHTFRSKHRAVERAGGPDREYQTGAEAKAEAKRIREGREGKGTRPSPTATGRTDEEVVYVTDEDEDVIESGTVVSAPAVALQRRKEVEALGEESTVFHGEAEFDYQGRSYMHVPLDLDVDLRKEPGSVTNYIPKKLIHTWKGHFNDKAVTALRFFPGAGHLLLASGADSTVKIFDVYHQRELLRSYHGHGKAVSDICFNNSGNEFISSGYDRFIKLWDTETGVCKAKFTTGKTPHVIKFNPSYEHSHEFVAGMSDNKIVQWDTRTKEIVQEYDHHLAAINTITFVDEGRRFMTTADDKSLRVWDYSIPVPIKYHASEEQFALTRAARHPSGKYVAYQSGNNEVQVFSAQDKFRRNSKKLFKGHNSAGSAIDLSVSPDGQFLASGDTAGYLCFWDWKTCKMYHKIQASQNGSVSCVQWHPQETSRVVAAGQDGVIRYYD
ncbi:hypothetical protein PG987_010335 [Apiospora arundinis]